METKQLLRNKLAIAETGIEIKKTICAICEGAGTSCGINAYVKDGRLVKVEGNPDFPHSGGTLCSKGSASRQYVYSQDRLTTPLKRTGPRGGGEFMPISWDEAYDIIADKLLGIKAQYGPESVIFGVGYTKWLRPFIQRLGLSFGSPNFATESSTCFYATALASFLTYGSWFGGPDIAHTDCLLLWTANPLHTATPSAKRMLGLKERGIKLIEVNPMVTPLTRYADYHLALRPGTDGALALGFAHIIINANLYDKEFVENYTLGFGEFKDYVQEFTPAKTAQITGVPEKDIIGAARLYASSAKAAIQISACPTVHHTNGVQNHRAIIALAGLTGNWDRQGGNYLQQETWIHVNSAVRTNHEEFLDQERILNLAPIVGADKFPVWAKLIKDAQAVHMPFQMQSGQPYPIKAVLAFGYNQRMWPGNDFLIEQLKQLDFFVNIDLFMTDTCKLADIVLPACSSFERSELRFYPGNYGILTQPVIDPVGEAKSDAEIIFELAKRIAPHDDLMARGYEACLDYVLEPTGVTAAELKRHPNGMPFDVTPIPFEKYKTQGFGTASGKMEFTSTLLKENGYDALPVYREPKLSPVSTPEIAENFPLVLGTGTRLPMYIHSRTFRNPWDRALKPKPIVWINPEDAAARNINNGDPVRLSTPRGHVDVWAEVTGRIVKGAVNIHHGWSEIETNRLIDPDYQDPISGYPGYKSLLCQIEKR